MAVQQSSDYAPVGIRGYNALAPAGSRFLEQERPLETYLFKDLYEDTIIGNPKNPKHPKP